jgi:DsbC/DsbD-like thiol-disulfide interchange protein
MRHLVQAAAALLAATMPALGGATDWQELAPDTRIRLIAAETASGGKTWIAVELDMPADTKTYWRVPGETGIPTRLDLAGSEGVEGHRMVWPYPQLETLEGYTDFVYYGSLVIPVELTISGENPVVQASLLMGVCSDICVPATARFTLPLHLEAPDPGQSVRINQALAAVPIDWSGTDAPIGEVTFDRAKGLLHVSVDSSRADPGSLIVDASVSGHLFGAPQKSPQIGLVDLPLLGGGDEAGLEGQPIQLVFMTPDGPFEVSRRVVRSTAGGS